MIRSAARRAATSRAGAADHRPRFLAVAGQRIQVGMVHAGRTVTVETADTTWRIYHELLTEVARPTTKNIARTTAQNRKVDLSPPARLRRLSTCGIARENGATLIHHEHVEPAEALDKTRDAAALWSVGYVRAAELVDAACDLLVTEHDGPTLAMLAGVHTSHADEDCS